MGTRFSIGEVLRAVPLMVLGVLVSGCGGGGSTGLPNSPTPFTLQGTVSGLTGTGLILQDSVAGTVKVAPGSTTFSFPNTLLDGQKYSVSVPAAVISPLQTCDVMNATGTIGGAQASISVICSAVSELAIAANSQPQGLSVYAIDTATGALFPVPGGPFAAGLNASSVAVDASGQFVLVSDREASTISVYLLNSSTGSLTAVAGSPFAADSGPGSIVIDPTGNIAYVANVPVPTTPGLDTISGFAIDASSGALTALGGSPYALGQVPSFAPGPPEVSLYNVPLAISISPTGGSLYATYSMGPDFGGSDGVLGYSIDPAAGTFAAISPAPFAYYGNSGMTYPGMLTITPSGAFAYWPTAGNDHGLESYAIDSSTGALSPGGVIAGTLPDSPSYAAIDPSGSFLYLSVGNGVTNPLLAFTIDGATGALTAVPGSPYALTNQGMGPIAVDPSGKYVYVEGSSPSGIYAFSITSADGSLTTVAGSPFAGGSGLYETLGFAFAPVH